MTGRPGLAVEGLSAVARRALEILIVYTRAGYGMEPADLASWVPSGADGRYARQWGRATLARLARHGWATQALDSDRRERWWATEEGEQAYLRDDAPIAKRARLNGSAPSFATSARLARARESLIADRLAGLASARREESAPPAESGRGLGSAAPRGVEGSAT